MISFIVSAFDRPFHLRSCVYSLLAQTAKGQIIVVDNNPTEGFNKIGEPDVEYVHAASKSCYDPSQAAVALCHGEWLCFPSDDSYYVPDFAAQMEWFGIAMGLGLVYCDMLYDRRLNGKSYSVLSVAPSLGSIDKTGFIVRRDVFKGFPPHPNDYRDGAMIEELVSRGVKHGKVNDVLVVHN